jgi:PHD/YefM family antitoxin component YafN of YafNO toxin-antitoxin module
MKQHIHQLKDEDMKGELRAILDECKADKKPVHFVCEEHGEYVVINRSQHRALYSETDMQESLQAIRESEEDIAAGRTYPIEEVFEEIRKRHGF